MPEQSSTPQAGEWANVNRKICRLRSVEQTIDPSATRSSLTPDRR